jgi:hypothetical protein
MTILMTNLNKVNLIPVHFTNEDGDSVCILKVNTNVPIKPFITSLSVALEHLVRIAKEYFDDPESVEKEEIKQMAISLFEDFEDNLLNEQDREDIRVLRHIQICYLDGLLESVLYCENNLTLSEIYENSYMDPNIDNLADRDLTERSVKDLFLSSPVEEVLMNLQFVLWCNEV